MQSDNPTTRDNNSILSPRYLTIRKQSLIICEPLQVEDYVVQPTMDVSPPKWHLAHTTWFFEAFVLLKCFKGFKVYREDFHYLFNSYYISAGERWARADRGNLTRPSVQEVIDYRTYVDAQMVAFLASGEVSQEIKHVIEVGLNHEQQHQELLVYDIKYILGHNPTYPVYQEQKLKDHSEGQKANWLKIGEGIYDIGHDGKGFCFDNELGRHRQFLHAFEISSALVTNAEYLEFVQSGGYKDHFLWLSEGWDWVNSEQAEHPMYWEHKDGLWMNYTLGGLVPIDLNAPVSHISFFEADAYAKWRGCRLPTEFEWEVAARQFQPELSEKSNFVEEAHFETIPTGTYDFLGNLWEWTSSAYRPYPFYQAPEGPLGEYNGKFMINQMVLRGGSYATQRHHIRHTYRNFFHPHLRWMCSGIRMARHT
ncbi:MAG: ergothioneine biosynthesis protein EgtB [Cyclobacteriaceae bacterium]